MNEIKLAHDVRGDCQDFGVVERLEELERAAGPLRVRLPLQVDEKRAVEVDHRVTARAGLAARDAT